jgi:hypothetical protein
LNHELGFHEYNVYRFDRNSNTSSLSRGGGVLIAVRNTFLSQIIPISNNNIEALFVLIKFPKFNFIISSVYIPIKSNETTFNDYFNIVESVYDKYPNADFLLLGDFNLPSATF